MNIIFLGGNVVTLPFTDVIIVADELTFIRALQMDADAMGVFMAGSTERGIFVTAATRSAKVTNPLYCLMYGPQADHSMIAAVLNAGADQVEKFPIEEELFKAQVKAVYGRGRAVTSSLIKLGDVTFDPETGLLLSPEGAGRLTRQESDMLMLLVDAQGRLVEKDHAHELLFAGNPDAPHKKILDVVVCKIRKKIGRLTQLDYIASVWGKGFQFVPEGFKPEVLTYRTSYGQFLPRAAE